MNVTNEFLKYRDAYIEKQFGRLNPVQKKAVFSTEGPLLILAGAGSGKTTVLVNRIANIIRFGKAHGSDWLPGPAGEGELTALKAAVETGAPLAPGLERLLRYENARPWNVLAITFTNKAAGELKARLAAMLGEETGADVNASTFHSACVRMLRRDADRLGFPKSFTIYDTSDQERAMKEVYKELLVDDKFLPIKSAMGQIGRMKDQLISPDEAMEAPQDTKAGLLAKVYRNYSARLKKAGAMDFDDLIYYTVLLLRENPDVLEYYQQKYRYVLVDEYQDTSVAQFHLVRLLAGGYKNVCVVGDDDQSIYRFRGATIENILNFEQHFPGAQVIRLEQNYRSTSNILDAANCVIKNNQGRKGKTLWTENGAGDRVHHYLAESEQDEASHIATVIGQHLKEGARLRDHAVLYRMNAQSGPVETYFARAGIPYKIVGGQRFYDRKEVKDIISYMSIVANPNDDLRLKRIINEPARKIGATTLDKMSEIAAGLGVNLLSVCENAKDYPAISRAASALNGFYGIYLKLVQASETLPLDEFVSRLLEITGYKKMLEAQGDEGASRLENLGQLISSVKTYADQKGEEATLAGFLEEVALISDLDSYDEENDVVVMMTMHSAKGLEYDYVFIVGLEEGIFPSDMCRFSDEELEEERRLCYVGITRAKKELYLSSSQSRMIFGRTQRNPPSRFLDEIDSDLLDMEESPAVSGGRSWGGGFGSFGGFGGASREGGHGFGSGAGFGGGAAAAPRREWGASSSFGGRSAAASTGGGSRFGASPSGRFGTSTVGAAAPARPAASAGAGSKSFKPGDVVEHKVFGRGVVLKATPAAGDTIVEIRFEKAGVKKTMANYAPLTLIK